MGKRVPSASVVNTHLPVDEKAGLNVIWETHCAKYRLQFSSSSCRADALMIDRRDGFIDPYV